MSNGGIMRPRDTWQAIRFTLITLAIHFVLWADIVVLLLLVVPLFQRFSQDYNVQLPWLAAAVVKASSLTMTYLPGVVAALALILAVDAVVVLWLSRRPDRKVARWVWVIVLILIPLLLTLAAGGTMLFVYISVMNGLGK